ncbi:MAG: dimethyl sulfoxide reductase anchor subunit [Chlamydiae bacterium]|nr:dimethyl sulfoxide reductase anchor subunit [Chlamydiota bacterium]
MSENFSLIDLLDEQELPLKNRVNKSGYYSPKESLIPTEPLKEGEQYRFHFDMSQCIGCQCCVVACNEQNNNPPEVNWRRVGEIEGGFYPNTQKLHLSMACNHCLDPSCLTGCPTDAYVKLNDGIVKHKAEECIGCGYCTWNCPYGVPQYNSERNIVTKCDMCHSRLKDGDMPACVSACPEQAIRIEKVNVAEWRKEHTQADAPGVPNSEMTISTTRITLPKNIPTEMLKANRHHIEPEKPHTSLIFMTVLTQASVGGFLILWLSERLSTFFDFLKPLQDFMAFGASGMIIMTGVAMLAALFHLGRPLYAYKALRMWRRSWLSREVLFFSLFSVMGNIYAGLALASHFLKFQLSNIFYFGLGGTVALLGLAGVYASAKIYLVPARPAWNTIRTPLRFFLTGFILGPLFSLVIYSIYVAVTTQEIVARVFQGPAIAFLIVSMLAGFFQLVVLLARLFNLHEDQSTELYGSTFLLIHRFKKHFLTRMGLLVIACFIIPEILFHFLNPEKLSAMGLIWLSSAAFVGGEH